MPIPLQFEHCFRFAVCICDGCVCSLSNIAFLFARYDDDGNKCCIVFRFFSLFSLSLLFCLYQLLFAFAIACLYIRQCSNWHTLPFNPKPN